jgi:hypothetical protein
MERHLTPCDYDFESATISLEHILPEHPEMEWLDFNESDHDKFVYRLGNMTLLHSGQNRDVGNKRYDEKRAVYQDSDFEVTRKLAQEYEEWTPQKIESRQQWMARQATSIWRIDL